MATDPRLHVTLQAAVNRIRTTVSAAAQRTADSLGTTALSAAGARQRDLYLGAQFEFGRRAGAFNQRFGEVLFERVTAEIQPRGGPGARNTSMTDWQSLSLVQDDEVEELLSADRLAQAITHECEWELRELSTFMGTLLHSGRAELERNPLRPEIIGKALFRAIEVVTTERDVRALLSRELSRAVSQAMRACYGEIIADLQGRGIRPVNLTVKSVEGPGNELPRAAHRENSAYDTLSPDLGGNSRYDSRYDSYDAGPAEDPRYGAAGDSRLAGSSGRGGYPSTGGRRGGGYGGGAPSGYMGGAPSGYAGGADTGSYGGASGYSDTGRDPRRSRYVDSSHAPPARRAAVEPRMIDLIRRLAFLGGGARDAARDAAREDAGLSGLRSTGFGPSSGGGVSSRGSGSSGLGSGGPGGSGAGSLSGRHGEGEAAPGTFGRRLMAPNLIRAHRDELRQASTGALDLMVIDVVGSLFDQILSDPKVPPQMARLIARLQLPVLRVALGDITFFSSRRHPVRRFINRIASLACAFDDFSEGPGLELLGRVRDLVQEIIEGDFAAMDLYEAKLDALEAFTAQQNEHDAQSRADATTLVRDRETEARLQQRYLQTLQAALAPLSMPGFIRDFLVQVWTQTIIRAVHRDGPQSEEAKRFRLAGRELVMSVQPKGSPTHRKNFLMKLPQLMKDLNAGLDLIDFPAAQRKAFFAELLPAHAESLKGQPLSELDYNMMASEIDSLLGRSVPKADEMPAAEAVPEMKAAALEDRFTQAEAQRIGLVPESAVDWDGFVDIGAGNAADAADPGNAADIDINIDGLPPADPPEPVRGAALMDHVQIGFAYQMHIQGNWQKVRLSYVSPGRAFFVFTRGRKHQETISLTARMLARLCDTGRLRPFENAYLLERATARARQQLKEIGATTRSGGRL